MPWQQLEARISDLLMRKARASVAMPDLKLFGEAPTPSGFEFFRGDDLQVQSL
ncbi:MAG: hypothetical protein RLZZ352_1593 [Pseudomonadota bacterium]|jgi:hypothetical protein